MLSKKSNPNNRTMLRALQTIIPEAGDNEYPLKSAHAALSRAYDAHDHIDKVAFRILNDPTRTPVTRKIAAAESAVKQAKSVRVLFRQAVELIEQEQDKIVERMRAAETLPSDKEALGSEIRSHFAQADKRARAGLIAKAEKANDTLTMKALSSAPAYLSGIDETARRRVASQLHDPADRDYLTRLTEASESLPDLEKQFENKVSQYNTPDVQELVAAANLARTEAA